MDSDASKGYAWSKGVQIEWNKATLHDTSWTTAQRTGALSYMTYREVNRYAAVYRLQADFIAAQDSAESAAVEAYSVFIRKSKGQPGRVPEAFAVTELEANWRAGESDAFDFGA